MSIALWCVVIAGLMPYVWTGVAKAKGERFNNRRPRQWQASLEGLPARAHAAHMNAFEAFPLFAAAVIVAQMLGAAQGPVDGLAILFTAFRIAYGLAYLGDTHLLRSALWFGALLSTLALFALAAMA